MKHASLRLAVVGALVALALAGCGGGSKTGDATATKPQTSAAQTNGLEKKSAAQVQLEAAAALKTAKSVHLTGTGRSDDGTPMRLDMRYQGTSSAGTVAQDYGQFEITVIGSVSYLKADQKMWKRWGAPAALQRLAAGRSVRLSPKQGHWEGLSLDAIAGQLAVNNESPLEPTVQQTTLDGRKVVVISEQNGSKLYVANTGPAYPLHGDNKGVGAGRMDFTEYGADFHITPPTNAVDLDQPILS
jgi:hypothetical protein